MPEEIIRPVGMADPAATRAYSYGVRDGNLVYLAGQTGVDALRLTEDGIPIYPRTLTVVNEEMGNDVVAVMDSHNVCLLKGHGMTVAGASVEEATLTSLTVYELARLNYLAYAIGAPSPVPDLEDHHRRWAAQGDRRRRGTNAAGEPSAWRYQRKLLEVGGA